MLYALNIRRFFPNRDKSALFIIITYLIVYFKVDIPKNQVYNYIVFHDYNALNLRDCLNQERGYNETYKI